LGGGGGAPEDEPLDRLAVAAQVAQRVGELGQVNLAGVRGEGGEGGEGGKFIYNIGALEDNIGAYNIGAFDGSTIFHP
jgi:hypothetical protein